MYSLDTRDTGFRTIIQQSAHRVIRVGSWSDPAWGCRCAMRNWYPPGYRNSSVGFRTVIKV